MHGPAAVLLLPRFLSGHVWCVGGGLVDHVQGWCAYVVQFGEVSTVHTNGKTLIVITSTLIYVLASWKHFTSVPPPQHDSRSSRQDTRSRVQVGPRGRIQFSRSKRQHLRGSKRQDPKGSKRPDINIKIQETKIQKARSIILATRMLMVGTPSRFVVGCGYTKIRSAWV